MPRPWALSLFAEGSFFSVTSRSSGALDVVLALTSYQLLFLDRENQVQLVRSLYSEDDAAAIVAASLIIAGRAAELWNGGRLVLKFDWSSAMLRTDVVGLGQRRSSVYVPLCEIIENKSKKFCNKIGTSKTCGEQRLLVRLRRKFGHWADTVKGPSLTLSGHRDRQLTVCNLGKVLGAIIDHDLLFGIRSDRRQAARAARRQRWQTAAVGCMAASAPARVQSRGGRGAARSTASMVDTPTRPSPNVGESAISFAVSGRDAGCNSAPVVSSTTWTQGGTSNVRIIGWPEVHAVHTRRALPR
jgi:hypothetical protein